MSKKRFLSKIKEPCTHELDNNKNLTNLQQLNLKFKFKGKSSILVHCILMQNVRNYENLHIGKIKILYNRKLQNLNFHCRHTKLQMFVFPRISNLSNITKITFPCIF